MAGFKTNSSTYYVDKENKLLIGENLDNPIKFTEILTVIGCPGVILKMDGTPFVTEKVIALI